MAKSVPTDQEVFDKSIRGLIAQGKAAIVVTDRGGGDPDVCCVYRDSDGCGCAIGIVLPEHILKHKWMKNANSEDTMQNVHDLMKHHVRALRPYLGNNMGFLNTLQACHDHAAFSYDENNGSTLVFGPDEFMVRLHGNTKALALGRGLTPIPDHDWPAATIEAVTSHKYG